MRDPRAAPRWYPIASGLLIAALVASLDLAPVQWGWLGLAGVLGQRGLNKLRGAPPPERGWSALKPTWPWDVAMLVALTGCSITVVVSHHGWVTGAAAVLVFTASVIFGPASERARDERAQS